MQHHVEAEVEFEALEEVGVVEVLLDDHWLQGREVTGLLHQEYATALAGGLRLRYEKQLGPGGGVLPEGLQLFGQQEGSRIVQGVQSADVDGQVILAAKLVRAWETVDPLERQQLLQIVGLDVGVVPDEAGFLAALWSGQYPPPSPRASNAGP